MTHTYTTEDEAKRAARAARKADAAQWTGTPEAAGERAAVALARHTRQHTSVAVACGTRTERIAATWETVAAEFAKAHKAHTRLMRVAARRAL